MPATMRLEVRRHVSHMDSESCHTHMDLSIYGAPLCNTYRCVNIWVMSHMWMIQHRVCLELKVHRDWLIHTSMLTNAFGLSFFQSHISIHSLLLYVSFAAVRWKETKSIEIGEWDWMTNPNAIVCMLTNAYSICSAHWISMCTRCF